MRGFAKPVADLIRSTAIESDEVELAQLRKLPLREQLEVGIVLYEAMLQQKRSEEAGNERLAGVRSVEDARRFLDQSRGTLSSGHSVLEDPRPRW
jgi:hypothetical protein